MSADRDHLVLFVNGRRREVRGADALASLSDFLRDRLGLVGTKIVCSEGDCGSCTVLCGRACEGQLVYRPIDSCIQRMFQLDGTHVVSVEGIGTDGQLSSVQQSMIDCHGSQCGFCTPGFVVAMAGLLEERKTLDEDGLRYGLTGNLCRCTGYTPIIEAGLHLDSASAPRIDDLYPPETMLAESARLAQTPFQIVARGDGWQRTVYSPVSLDDAVQHLAGDPQARLVAGATDVGVQLNKRTIVPDSFVDLNRVQQLEGVDVRDGVVTAGARATWTELEAVFQTRAPQFGEMISVFGSPQIRHTGTIGGNIANASPIADSLPFLLVMESELELYGPQGPRRVNINDFYRGYKQIDLRPGELIRAVRIPLPAIDDALGVYKVSRRRDLDIATFTAAIRLRCEDTTIREAAVALGAVGPTVLRARQTERYLVGQSPDEPTMRAAGKIAVGEIAPITDVRGKSDFRYQLTRNVFLKFYHEQVAAHV